MGEKGGATEEKWGERVAVTKKQKENTSKQTKKKIKLEIVVTEKQRKGSGHRNKVKE